MNLLFLKRKSNRDLKIKKLTMIFNFLELAQLCMLIYLKSIINQSLKIKIQEKFSMLNKFKLNRWKDNNKKT